MSPAHPETVARTHIYQACLPRKKAIQQPMLGIFVQIKATRSIGGEVTMLPVETSGTQSGSDPQSGDSSQVEPGRTRNTAQAATSVCVPQSWWEPLWEDLSLS